MPTEQEARFRERQAAAEGCNWAVSPRRSDPNAFITWLDGRFPSEESTRASDPEPTPEAVSAFNERQMERRRCFVEGFAESLPEHRAEGVMKAAERFPLKRLVASKGVGHVDGLRAECGHDEVYFTKGNGDTFYLSGDGLRASLALLNERPRLEDVPLEEEEDA